MACICRVTGCTPSCQFPPESIIGLKQSGLNMTPDYLQITQKKPVSGSAYKYPQFGLIFENGQIKTDPIMRFFWQISRKNCYLDDPENSGRQNANMGL